jgi:hypothetical protein
MNMVDEIYDRQYRDGRRELNDFLTRVGNAVGNAFAVLNRIEYSAPWLDGSRGARNH